MLRAAHTGRPAFEAQFLLTEEQLGSFWASLLPKLPRYEACKPWPNWLFQTVDGLSQIACFFSGDVLEMKKEHPCGARRWEVLRVGMDFRLRCTGCGREVMLPRKKAEKALKKIISPADQAGEDRRNPYAL